MFDVERVIPDTKIQLEQYLQFLRSYYLGEHPHERIGQAFINKYLRYELICFPELFHERETKKALALIEEHFVGWE